MKSRSILVAIAAPLLLVACASSSGERATPAVPPAAASPAPKPDAKDIVEAFVREVFVEKNVDAAARYLTPEYRQHNPAHESGLAAFQAAFRDYYEHKAPADLKTEIVQIVAEKDLVVVYLHVTATRKNGQHVDATGFDMFRVDGDRITDHWDAIPPPPA